MTRFGVMKHLRVLEDAGLVVTRRRGREKLHYLNAVPIRLIHDRWVSKYAEPWAAALSDIKERLEDRRWRRCSRSTSRRPRSACGRRSPTVSCAGATTSASASPPTGPPVRATRASHPTAPGPLLEGENLEVDPPRRLVQSFRALWGEDARAEGTSRVTWEIEQVEDSCRLTVVHDELREGASAELYGGWPMILSGLKTLLETGESLTTPARSATPSRRPPDATRTETSRAAGIAGDARRRQSPLVGLRPARAM